MKFTLLCSIVALFCLLYTEAKSTPKSTDLSIDSLLDLAYKGHAQDIPTDCSPLRGDTVVNKCDNGTTPLLRISQLHMDKYPLEPGHTNFFMIYKLTERIERGSKLYISSFSDMKDEIFDGELDLCDYLAFANINCPVDITDGFQEMRQTLEIPPDVPPGVYSFVATATTADGRPYVRVAANIELQNKEYNSIVHDEL